MKKRAKQTKVGHSKINKVPKFSEKSAVTQNLGFSLSTYACGLSVDWNP